VDPNGGGAAGAETNALQLIVDPTLCPPADCLAHKPFPVVDVLPKCPTHAMPLVSRANDERLLDLPVMWSRRYNAISRGEIKAIRIGRPTLISQAQLDALLAV
jgi:hypothetical protein